MKVSKVVSMGVGYVRKDPYEYQGQKFEADIKDGDIISVIDEGQIVVGQYGEQHVFKVKTRNGEKAMTFNQTSMNNMIDAFTDETANWKDKELKVWIIKALVSGKMQKVVYVSDKSAEMTEDEEGRLKFLNPEQGSMNVANAEDEINFDNLESKM